MVARRFIKLKDAFEKYLNTLINNFQLTSKDLKDPNLLNNLGSLSEMTMREMYTHKEVLRIDFSVAVRESIEKRFFYDPPKYTSTDLDNIDKSLKILNQHSPHDQRSLEWYAFRQGHITASDIAKALGEKGDKSRWDLLYQKAIPVQEYIEKRNAFSLDSKPAIKHGKCFEDVAIALYEKANNVKVKDYGCLPHLFIDHLAASPDGIVYSRDTNPGYHGRMLEIKCPYSRVINGIIKLEYYMQIQIQLEVCDLEYCDFLECDIRTYGNMTEFFKDSPKGTKSYTTRLNGKDKGVLYEYNLEGEKSILYKYCPLGLTDDKVREWMKKTKAEIASNPKADGLGFVYWYLEEFNVVLVKRELNYFENIRPGISNFWASVQYHKKNGLDEIKEKLGLLPKKRTPLELFLGERPKHETDKIKLQNGYRSQSEDDLEKIEFLDLDDSDDENSKLKKKGVKKEEKKIQKEKPKRRRECDNLEFLEINDDSESEEEEVINELPKVEPSTSLIGRKEVLIKQVKSLIVIKPE